MQAPCAQHANRHAGQKGGHDEVWRDFAGHDVLVSGLDGWDAELEEFPGIAFRWLDPAGACIPEQKGSVQGEQTEGKTSRKKSLFRNEAPVYRPFVEEGPAEFKRASKVTGCLFSEGIAV